MLNSIKTTLTSAPSRIYNKAAETVSSARSKIGEFHNRSVAPKVAAAKEGITGLKDQLKAKYNQLRGGPSEPQNKAVSINEGAEAPKKSFEEELGGLRAKLLGNPKGDLELLRRNIAALMGQSTDVGELAQALLLMDSFLGNQPLPPEKLQNFQTTIAHLPFTDANLQHKLENCLALKNRSFSNLHPQIQSTVQIGVSEKLFSESLKGLSEVSNEALSHFVCKHQQVLSDVIQKDPDPVKNALGQNKHLAGLDTDGFIALRTEFLNLAEEKAVNPGLKKKVEGFLFEKISTNLLKNFQYALPKHLENILNFPNHEGQGIATVDETLKGIKEEFKDTPVQKSGLVPVSLAILRQMNDIELKLFLFQRLTEKGVEVPPSIKHDVYSACNNLERRLPFLQKLSERGPIPYEGKQVEDPLALMAKALIGDMQALKAKAAQGLGLSEGEFSRHMAGIIRAAEQASYPEGVEARLKKIMSNHYDALFECVKENNESGIREIFAKALDTKSLSNPFSEDGKGKLALGKSPGELDFKLVVEPGQDPQLVFTIQAKAEEKQQGPEKLLQFPLKARKDVSTIKERLVEKTEYEYNSKMQELALLQLAAQAGKELKSSYDLENLKKTLINQETQNILNERLEYKPERQKETKLRFKEELIEKPGVPDFSPAADPVEKSLKSILKPSKNNAEADDLIYAEAKEQATQKVEADLKAYMEKNAELIQQAYTKRVEN